MADHGRPFDVIGGEPAGKLIHRSGKQIVYRTATRPSAGKAVHLDEDQAVVLADPRCHILEHRCWRSEAGDENHRTSTSPAGYGEVGEPDLCGSGRGMGTGGPVEGSGGKGSKDDGAMAHRSFLL